MSQIGFQQGVLQIPSATLSQTDAAQYMYRLYRGRKILNFNLCGPFTIAYCTQDETGMNSIDAFLDYWEAQPQSPYQRIFQQGLGRTTSLYDLESWLSEYDLQTHRGDNKWAPEAFAATLQEYQLIAGVRVDYSGYLRPQGFAHWVVLDELEYFDKQHQTCWVYNSFTNNREPYSGDEFYRALGTYRQLLWVKRSS